MICYLQLRVPLPRETPVATVRIFAHATLSTPALETVRGRQAGHSLAPSRSLHIDIRVVRTYGTSP